MYKRQDPATSCLAAIYFQDPEAIQLKCRVATESADFILERLNETTFVSVAKDGTGAMRQLAVRASTPRNTARHAATLVLHHSGTLSNGI